MKKVRSVFSAIIVVIAVGAAFAFRPVDLDGTGVFRLDPTTGQLLLPPHGLRAEPGSICVENPDIYCTRLYNVDENGDPTTPADDATKGEYMAPQ